MAQQIADRRDIDFVLHELLEIEKLTETKKFGEFNRKAFDLIDLHHGHRWSLATLPPEDPQNRYHGARPGKHPVGLEVVQPRVDTHETEIRYSDDFLAVAVRFPLRFY